MYVRMYVCMYVCIYVCVYVCVCMYDCTYVCMCVFMYVCTYEFMYVCLYVHTYVCVYACTYECMYVCTYICMYVCENGFFYPSVYSELNRCFAVCNGVSAIDTCSPFFIKSWTNKTMRPLLSVPASRSLSSKAEYFYFRIHSVCLSFFINPYIIKYCIYHQISLGVKSASLNATVMLYRVPILMTFLYESPYTNFLLWHLPAKIN